MKIRVALAEDNFLLSKSIREKLSFFSDKIEFCYHAWDGAELLNKLQENHAIDVILMDIEMPNMDGIQATEQVAKRYPQIKVIMLTVFDDEQRLFNAIQAGAMGYLLKDEPPDRILESIQSIMQGGAPMSPAIASKTLNLLRKPGKVTEQSTNEDFSLTKRERQVLEQLNQGLDYQEISQNLFISPGTVRKHIENIYKKLQVNNKMRAVNKATRHGLI